jgi:hypothetical protein
MRRWRKPLALLCVAVIALAVFVPTDGAGDVVAFLMPVWLEFQPDFVVVAPLESTSPAEQAVALRSLTAFRGPPAAPSA